jgi:hypothetical protein
MRRIIIVRPIGLENYYILNDITMEIGLWISWTPINLRRFVENNDIKIIMRAWLDYTPLNRSELYSL